ncbi:MAG: hypothetical protein M1828_005204 [Chrysothrix sp. TS-e1954]|nr:MAG: hypothetical protein M1828_005204 [Chrysothrix sp. TS-e1954]
MSVQSSSPDPLANSLDDSYHRVGSPSKSTLVPSPLRPVAGPRPSRKRLSKLDSVDRTRKPVIEVSTPTKRNADRFSRSGQNTSELILHTPTTTGTGHDNSPWRIRVTVERDESHMESSSPSQRRTRTTKVPLKGADESKPAKRRGRPRKSDVWAQDMAEVDDSGIQNPKMVDNKRKRKSTNGPGGKKRRQSGFVRDLSETDGTGLPVEEGAEDVTQPSDESKVTREQPGEHTDTGTHHSPKAATPKVAAPRRIIDFSSLTPLHKKPQNVHLLSGPDFCEQVEEKTMRSLKGRIPTPRKPAGWSNDDDSSGAEDDLEHEDQMTTIDPSTATRLQNDGLRTEDAAYFSEDQESTEDAAANDEAGYNAQDDTQALDRSLAESEGFSMVSIESLRSQREQAKLEAQHAERQAIRSHEETQDQFEPENGESRSECPTYLDQKHRENNEASVESTTGLFSGFGDGTRRALRSGLHMGQLLAGPNGHSPARAGSDVVHDRPPSRRGQLQGRPTAFARLPSPPESVDHSEQVASRGDRNGLERTEQESAGYDDMSWRATTLPKQPKPNMDHYSEMSWKKTTPPKTRPLTDSEELTHTQLAEQRYEQERRRVSHEIDQANTSEVIIIDSSIHPYHERQGSPREDGIEGQSGDDDDIEMIDADAIEVDPTLGSDIWQAEADRSLEDSLESQHERHASLSQVLEGHTKSKQSQIPTITSQDPTPDLRDLFPIDESGPQRGKIPRSWRRVSGDSSFLYSDESVDQEPPPPRFAAFKSPGPLIAPSIPTVLQRWATRKTVESSSIYEEESEPTPVAKTPRRSILSTPDRRGSSPAKEVRFAEEEHTYAESIAAEEEPCSSSMVSSRDESRKDDLSIDTVDSISQEDSETSASIENTSTQVSSTQVSLVDDLDSHNRPVEQERNPTGHRSADSILDTSDVRQLKRELRSTVNSLSSAAIPGLFSRFISWLYPPVPTPTFSATKTLENVSSSSTVTQDAKGAEAELVWTRNHYLLLDHIYRIALSSKLKARHSRPKLPPSFYLPLPTLYSMQIGKAMSSRPRCSHGTTPPRKGRRTSQIPCSPNCPGLPASQRKQVYEYNMTQTDMRVVHAFCVDARDRGIPLVGDPSFGNSSMDNVRGKGRDVWPKRDGNGRVMRVQEDWDVDEVVRRVFSLWVGDRMRDEEGQEQETTA